MNESETGWLGAIVMGYYEFWEYAAIWVRLGLDLGLEGAAGMHCGMWRKPCYVGIIEGCRQHNKGETVERTMRYPSDWVGRNHPDGTSPETVHKGRWYAGIALTQTLSPSLRIL